MEIWCRNDPHGSEYFVNVSSGSDLLIHNDGKNQFISKRNTNPNFSEAVVLNWHDREESKGLQYV